MVTVFHAISISNSNHGMDYIHWSWDVHLFDRLSSLYSEAMPLLYFRVDCWLFFSFGCERTNWMWSVSCVVGCIEGCKSCMISHKNKYSLIWLIMHNYVFLADKLEYISINIYLMWHAKENISFFNIIILNWPRHWQIGIATCIIWSWFEIDINQ